MLTLLSLIVFVVGCWVVFVPARWILTIPVLLLVSYLLIFAEIHYQGRRISVGLIRLWISMKRHSKRRPRF